MNGKTKIILSIGSLIALLAITFNAGATWKTLDSPSACRSAAPPSVP